MKSRSSFILVAFLPVIFLQACGLASLPTPYQTMSIEPTARPGDPPADLSALPDLAVGYVNIAMQGIPVYPSGCIAAYAPYELRAMIENRGSSQASNLKVIELSTGYAVEIRELPAGQSVEVAIPAGSPNGAYHLSLDPQNLIAETDEGNNTAEYIAITPTPPILCPSTPPAETPFP